MHFAEKRRENRATGLNGSHNTMRTAFDYREMDGDEADIQLYSPVGLLVFFFFFFFFGRGGGDEYVMTSRIVCTREHVRRRENATRKRKNSWLT